MHVGVGQGGHSRQTVRDNWGLQGQQRCNPVLESSLLKADWRALGCSKRKELSRGDQRANRGLRDTEKQFMHVGAKEDE